MYNPYLLGKFYLFTSIALLYCFGFYLFIISLLEIRVNMKLIIRARFCMN